MSLAGANSSVLSEHEVVLSEMLVEVDFVRVGIGMKAHRRDFG
jgi:hypothetical protein